MTRTNVPHRSWRALLALVVATVLGLAACSAQAPTGSTGGKKDRHPAGQAAPVKPIAITPTPANGTSDANPVDPVQMTVTNGTISSLTLTSSTGAVVEGTFGAHRDTWKAAEVLGYGNTYTWSGTATGTDGTKTPITGSFQTLDPDSTLSAQLNVGDGSTYGIAMPIVVNFDQPVGDEDKPAVEKALSVETSVPTKGAWAWLSDSSVHWRPKEFWKPGTDVTVKAMLYGLSLGDGEYGQADVTTHFEIGRAQKIVGNVDTHRLKLLANGKVVHNYPASYGLDSVLWRNTRSGTHVVMAKHPTYYMSSERGGYEDVFVRWAVRISNNGEFIHAYPGSLWAQGNTNVSHGCVNLSTARAKTVYDWVQIGDPVIVKGSNVQLSGSDGAYYDWALDWETWESQSALSGA